MKVCKYVLRRRKKRPVALIAAGIFSIIVLSVAAYMILHMNLQEDVAEIERLPDISFSEDTNTKISIGLQEEAQKKEIITALVKAENETVAEELKDEIRKKGGKIKSGSSAGSIIEAEIPSQALSSLAKSPYIEGMWENRKFFTLLDKSAHLVNADAFWERGIKGTGVRIAVLDTGVNKNHPMLSGKVILEKSFVGGSAEDMNGHGTHVAGIAAGRRTDQISGIAPDALVINAKVLSDLGEGLESDIIEGIGWAIDPDSNNLTDDGAKVLVLSLGGNYHEQGPLNFAVKDAINKGVVVVVSSGNCGSPGYCPDFFGVTSPGNTKEAITVGAVNDNLEWASFSSGQEFSDYIKPDISAPGVGINSSFRDAYSEMSGTSMAAPHAAGLAADLLQANPSLKPEEVKYLLEHTARRAGEPGKDVKYGSGIVDASKLLSSNISLLLKYKTEVPEFVVQGRKMSFGVSSIGEIRSANASVSGQGIFQTVTLSNKTSKNWTGEFAQTRILGNYMISFRIEDLYGGRAEFNETFAVIPPSDASITIISLDADERAHFMEPYTISVELENQGTQDAYAVIEAQISGNGVLEWSEEALVDIKPSERKRQNITWIVNSMPGSKEIKIINSFGQNYTESRKNISVVSLKPPQFLNTVFPENATEGSPIEVSITVKDPNPVYGAIIKGGREYVLVGTRNPKGEVLLQALVTDTERGMNSLYAKICNQHSCINTSNYTYFGSECANPRLIVLAASEDSDYIKRKLNNSFCLSEFDILKYFPEESILNQHDAVIAYFGLRYFLMDKEKLDRLTNYSENGRTAFIGEHVSALYSGTEFSERALHASFGGYYNHTGNANITPAAIHPLSQLIEINGTSYESYKEVLNPENSGYAILEWAKGNAAAVAYESESSRAVTLAFAIQSANDNKLINRIAEWLLENISGDIIPDGVSTGYLIEGPSEINVTVNSSFQNATNLTISVKIDGFETTYSVMVSSKTTFQHAMNLSVGNHEVAVIVNPDLRIRERVYLNNVFKVNITVAPTKPDIRIIRAEAGNDTLMAEVSNVGGALARSEAKLGIDGISYLLNITLKPGESINLTFDLHSFNGKKTAVISLDPGNNIDEHNESNNELNLTVYSCFRQRILIVKDDDTNVGSFGPDSVPLIQDALSSEGYCVETWNESERGAVRQLNRYPLVVWVSDARLLTVMDENNTRELENFKGKLIFAGDEIAYDHRNDTVLQKLAKARYMSDIRLTGKAELILSGHKLLENISNLTINGEISMYPDSIAPIEGTVAIANWSENETAITANRNTIFFAFSPSSLENPEVAKSLIKNSVKWLLENASNPTITLENITPQHNSRQTGNKAVINATALSLEAVTDTLIEGDTKEYLLHGITYRVAVDVVTSSDARITVNGNPMLIKEKQKMLIDNLTEITAKDIIYQDFSGGTKFLSFNLSHNDAAGCILEWNGENETMNYTSPNCISVKETDDGQTYRFKIYANNSAGNTNSIEYTAFVENSKPAGTIQISPATPKTADTINCIAMNITDNENDAITSVYEWDNGTTTIRNQTLSAEITAKNQTWTCTVILDDGYEETMINAQIKIYNTPPTISIIPNGTISINEARTLNFSMTAIDLDGDPLDYLWLLNGSNISESDTFVFKANHSSSGVYTITAIVSDGTENAQAQVNLIVNITSDQQSETHEFNLSFGIGWNVLSLPYSIPNYTAAAMLRDSGCMEVVRLRNNSFESFAGNSSDYDFDLEPAQGYFVRCKKYSSVAYSGVPMSADIFVEQGWNAVGVLEGIPNASMMLQSLDSQGINCSQIARWRYGSWEGYVKSYPFNNFAIKPGEGYLVKCGNSAVWRQQNKAASSKVSIFKSSVRELKMPS